METLRRSEILPTTALVAPSTDLERRICTLFAEALNLDEVGAEDDFFDLGGDSLKAEDMSMLVEEMGIPPFPAIKLFSLGTPQALAEWIAAQSPTA